MSIHKSFYAFIGLFPFFLWAQNLQQVSGFGTNPGNLNMYQYVPASVPGNAPLVVALHGCTQNAATYAAQSGWGKLADNHKFYVVYAEQLSANNSSNCFNWFQAGDQDRNQGEALSIKQMADYMKSHYSIDSTKVFVTGLSAGAAMTVVMLACYPDVFSAGAVMAGTPYKSATNASQALNVMYGYTTNTPQNWGDLVRNEFSYSGKYPKVAVFQGSADNVVSPVNETEIMKQWTNVHNTDQTPDAVISGFNGNPYVLKNSYNDAAGNEVVQTYTISGMGHAIALDTGSCYQQCGQTGTYALEVKLSSSFWSAYFFNILTYHPVIISGTQTVTANQSNVSYSVTLTANTSYTWSVPAGASIVSGQGTNQISVNFGTTSGNISLTETQGGCKVGPADLAVTILMSSAVQNVKAGEISFYQTADNSFYVKANESFLQMDISDINGGKINTQLIKTSTEIKPDLLSGLYIISLKGEKGVSVFKFMVR